VEKMDRMDIYKIIAGLIKVQLKCPECVVERSSDGASVVFTIRKYPAFPNGAEQDVIVTYPFTWLNPQSVNGKVAVTPSKINASSVRFWQGGIGNPFLHAHIFDNGRPCWGGNNQELSTMKEIILHLILTLRCVNISEFSLNQARKASSRFGDGNSVILQNAKRQAARVDKKYGLAPVNIIELTQWLDAQFRLRVGMLRG
jgi:hypothetical protein